MKKIFICIIVILIVILTFLVPNFLFEIEDLKMEGQSYKRKNIKSTIDIQAEKIYLVKAIHDIQEGEFNVKLSNYSLAVKSVKTHEKEEEKMKEELIGNLEIELQKMKEYNRLKDVIVDYDKTNVEYIVNTKEYSKLKSEYTMNRISITSGEDNIMGAELEEKTGKILYYAGRDIDEIPKIIETEKVLRQYIKYLELYIIDDWRFENNMLISEKAKLMANIVYYKDRNYVLSINSTNNIIIN